MASSFQSEYVPEEVLRVYTDTFPAEPPTADQSRESPVKSASTWALDKPLIGFFSFTTTAMPS